MIDQEFCRERLKTVRELAEKADPFVKQRLIMLARHYERRLAITGVTALASERSLASKPE
jgi:hypothetical protein